MMNAVSPSNGCDSMGTAPSHISTPRIFVTFFSVVSPARASFSVG